MKEMVCDIVYLLNPGGKVMVTLQPCWHSGGSVSLQRRSLRKCRELVCLGLRVVENYDIWWCCRPLLLKLLLDSLTNGACIHTRTLLQGVHTGYRFCHLVRLKEFKVTHFIFFQGFYMTRQMLLEFWLDKMCNFKMPTVNGLRPTSYLSR